MLSITVSGAYLPVGLLAREEGTTITLIIEGYTGAECPNPLLKRNFKCLQISRKGVEEKKSWWTCVEGREVTGQMV